MINDFTTIFLWGITIFLIGLINFPTTLLVFGKFFDRGYALSKILGLGLLSFLTLVLSTCKLLPFSRTAIILLVVSQLILNILLYKKFKYLFKFKFTSYVIFALEELLFFGGLFTWSIIRGYFPDINGLEKFMDYGFINSIINTTYLPPKDMWFSGENINYYWFGHLVTAILTKLSGIPSSVTYNLMIATILGLSLSGVFSIVFNFTYKYFKPGKSFVKKAIISGLLSAFLVNFAGNFHTPYYIWKNGLDKYWYPDATRFIGYNPETNDKTIHEFPIYSYVVSDLHAHLLNLPFVLLYIALLYHSILRNKETRSVPVNYPSVNFQFKNWISKNKHLLKLVPLGIILGLMFMTSTWDFGNYLILTAVVFTLFEFRKSGFSLIPLLSAAIKTIGVLILGIITAIPFLINFESIANGVDFVKSRTPLWQLLILWGFPLFLTLIFLFSLLKTYKRNFQKIKYADLFIGALLVTSWILIFLPEMMYVKDIYIASHHRANTMFKLTYQSYVMSYLAGGYVVLRFLDVFKHKITKLTLVLFISIILGSLFVYPKIATYSYYRDLKVYKGLNGESWLEKQNPDIYEAINWIRNNVKKESIILEAPGDSYTEKNVISSYTGKATVSGWFVHEWLWRGDSTFPQKRVDDITIIYTNPNMEITKSYLKKYSVDYVIIGPNELERFPDLYEQKFFDLGKVVFSNTTIKIFALQY